MSISTGMIGVTLAGKLATMMLYMVIGYVIVRAGVLKVSDSKALSSLVVWLLQPALLFDAFQIELTSEKRSTFLVCLCFSFLVYIVFILLSVLLKKPFRLTPVEQASMIYSNTGNLVFPLVDMILGPEYVFYGSAVQLVFHPYIWTHGITLIRGEKGFSIGRILKNSNIIAILAGLLCTSFHVRIPTIVGDAISGLGQMVGPTSMMVVGIALAGADLGRIFRTKRTWLISFGRLVFFPLCIIGLLFVSGFLRRNPVYALPLMIPVMAFAAPPASLVSQLAILYDRHPVEAGTINMLGTILCMVTMPLLIQFYQFLFL